MNILGVGGWELLAILLIMLIFAGPKRMVRWAYVIGTYVAKFRMMWSETVDVLQKEFDDAGVGIEIPKEIPTRGGINKQAASALGGLTKPIKDVMDQTAGEVNQIKTATSATARTASAAASGNGHAATTKPAARPSTAPTPPNPPKPARPEFGAWSGGQSSSPSADYGTWSGGTAKDDHQEG